MPGLFYGLGLAVELLGPDHEFLTFNCIHVFAEVQHQAVQRQYFQDYAAMLQYLAESKGLAAVVLFGHVQGFPCLAADKAGQLEGGSLELRPLDILGKKAPADTGVQGKLFSGNRVFKDQGRDLASKVLGQLPAPGCRGLGPEHSQGIVAKPG